MRILFYLLTFFLISFFNLFCFSSENKNIEEKNILVLSHDDLFKKSEPGKAIYSNFIDKRNKLLEESKKIEESFVSEELLLTQKREDLSSSDFQILANDFDKKVETTRKKRLEKDKSLQNEFNLWKKKFVKIILPIVKKVMSNYDASLVIDTNTRGIIYEQNLDITEEVINMLNTIYIENPEIFKIIVEGDNK